MSLPALSKNADTVAIAATVNRLVRDFNREDRKAPIVGTDTGTGTAYAIAPVPGIVMYEVGQTFEFQAVHANTTTAPTLAVNGLAAGTITDLAGSPLVVGDIAANSWVRVVCTSTTPTFALLSIQPASFLRGPRPILSSFSATLGANVTLNNTAAWFDGPSISQGTTGVFLVVAHVTLTNPTTNSNPSARLYDGTTVWASGRSSTWTAGGLICISISALVTNPAGNLRLQGNDPQFTNTIMSFNASGQSKDTMINAVRIG